MNDAIGSTSTAMALSPEGPSTFSVAAVSSKQERLPATASLADQDELVIIDDQETDIIAGGKDASP